MSTFGDELANQLQAVAIAHGAWRGEDNALADTLVKALNMPDRHDEIRRHLHAKPLHAALAGRDVALWIGHDGQMRLVDQQPSSYRAATLRTAHHPGPESCRYCLMHERQSLQPELQQEIDGRGETVAGSFVHQACATAWARLRALAASRQEAANG